jgi:hypothetical protein
MCKYFTGNAHDLLDMGAHVILEPPTTLEKLPAGKALVCIINTIPNVTITWCDSDDRMHDCMNMFKSTFTLWLLLDKHIATEQFV